MKLKIGIFDSGIGGFTILNSLLKTRKDVEVIYLADTKRIPFGNKNHHEISCLLYTSPSPRDDGVSRMPSSA